MLAHASLQVGEAVEVLDSSVGRFVAHSGVPAVVTLDDANESPAGKAGARALCVAGIVGEEVRFAVVFVAQCAHVRRRVKFQVIIA